jgi:hypothetical protein
MAKLKSFEQYVAEKQASANQEEINNLEVQEASVVMDAVDPKSKGLAKLLKKNKVSMEVIDQDGPSGFPEVELTGKREDLETVLADSQYGWDDADLAEYIEESEETFTVKVKAIEEGNAFGDAVRKAKEAGETEFEFDGETFKVEESEEVEETEEVEEGNAFGDAVRKAKEAGEDEFEFDGETFKVEEAEAIEEAVNASGYIKAGKLGYNDQFLGRRSLSWTLSVDLGLKATDEFVGPWLGFDHVSLYAIGKKGGTILDDALTGKYTYDELKAAAADFLGVKESEETEEVNENPAAAVAVAAMLKEVYESCKNEAKVWEEDAHDSHTVESYMAENAALVAALAAGALKEMKEDYSTEAYEAACNSMIESYTTKINEMKESELADDATDVE